MRRHPPDHPARTTRPAGTPLALALGAWGLVSIAGALGCGSATPVASDPFTDEIVNPAADSPHGGRRAADGTAAHAPRPARPHTTINPTRPAVDATALEPKPTRVEAAGVVTLLTDLPEAEAAPWLQVVVRALETMRDVFPPTEAALGEDGRARQARVLLFDDRDAFERYAEVAAPENRDAVGYYDPRRRELVVTRAAGSSSDATRLRGITATILHEATHLVIRDFAGHRFVPPWVDEGLASYYETGRPIHEPTPTPLSEPSPLRDRGSDEAALGGPPGPPWFTFGRLHGPFAGYVGELVRADQGEPGGPRVTPRTFAAFATAGVGPFVEADADALRALYARSWSRVYYLLHAERGRYREALIGYLRAIAAEPDPSMRYTAAYETHVAPVVAAVHPTWRLWALAAAGLPARAR